MRPTNTVNGVSSMATRSLLADLAGSYARIAPWTVEIEAMGGVDAARLVRGGASTDLVVLAANVMEALEREGLLAPGSRRDIARSGVAVAVRSGLARPAIATEADVREAVLNARTISYSSGPSGDHLKRLFERWGVASAIADRVVEAKPGMPVGQVVARGDADLGFQQQSEFLEIPGIDIVGPLPPEIQTLTVFTAAVGSKAVQADGARAFIDFAMSAETAGVKKHFGMEPVPVTNGR